MKVGNDLLIAPAIVCGLSVRSGLRKDCEGMHGGVARRQGRDASPGRDRKSVRRTVQRWRGAIQAAIFARCIDPIDFCTTSPD
jgi:hypothetical protein